MAITSSSGPSRPPSDSRPKYIAAATATAPTARFGAPARSEMALAAATAPSTDAVSSSSRRLSPEKAAESSR